jgi:hypothetical protein
VEVMHLLWNHKKLLSECTSCYHRWTCFASCVTAFCGFESSA